MIKWSGYITVFLGAAHLLLGLVLTASSHADSWVGGELWLPEEGMAEMGPAMGAFWFTLGSFGPPLIVVGMTVLWLDRRGIVPPTFIPWVLGCWSVLAAAIFEPAPWFIAWIAVALLAIGIRRAARQTRPEPRAA